MHRVDAETSTEYPADVAKQAAHRPRLGADATTTPPPGHPDHGIGTTLRRQPVRIVNGQAQGGYTDVFEVICPDCGDDPALGYLEVSPRLQELRGPRPLEEGLEAFERHFQLDT